MELKELKDLLLPIIDWYAEITTTRYSMVEYDGRIYIPSRDNFFGGSFVEAILKATDTDLYCRYMAVVGGQMTLVIYNAE